MADYRKIITSNIVLFRLALSQKLHQLMHVRKLVPRIHWMPPGLRQVLNLEDVLCAWEVDFREEFAFENKVSALFIFISGT